MQSDQKLIVNVSTFYSCSTKSMWFSLVLKILECSRQNFTSHFQGRISSGSVWSIRPTAWKLERGHQPWHNIGAGHEISEKEEGEMGGKGMVWRCIVIWKLTDFDLHWDTWWLTSVKIWTERQSLDLYSIYYLESICFWYTLDDVKEKGDK